MKWYKRRIFSIVLVLILVFSSSLNTFAIEDTEDAEVVEETVSEETLETTDNESEYNVDVGNNTVYDTQNDNIEEQDPIQNQDTNKTIIETQATSKVGVGNVTFYSASAFSIWWNSIKGRFNGTLQYLTSKPMSDTPDSSWQNFDKNSSEAYTKVAATKNSDGLYYVAMRGLNNTFVNNNASNAKIQFIQSGVAASVHASGNVESLLNYQTVLNGGHPPMADYAFYKLFNGSALATAPTLGAITLTKYCYFGMFTRAQFRLPPELPATTIPDYAYAYMFSESSASYPVTLPSSVNCGSKALYCMYYNCQYLRIFTSPTTLENLSSVQHGIIFDRAWKVNNTGSVDTGISQMFSGCAESVTAATGTTYYVRKIDKFTTVNKYIMDLSWTNRTYTYDGQPKNSGCPGLIYPAEPLGLFEFSTDNTNFTSDTITRTEIGTTTIYYRFTQSIAGCKTYWGTASGSYTLTIKGKPMSVTASGYTGVYDGKAHTGSVKVNTPSSGATIKYGTTSGNYNLNSPPTRTNAGTTTVYYQVTAASYETVQSSFTIKVTNASMSVSASGYTGTYDGNTHTGTIKVTTPSSGYTVTYSEEAAGTYSTTHPTCKTPGTYTIYYKVTATNYEEKTGNYTVKINNAEITATVSGYEGKYDGNEHYGTINVTKPSSGANITYSTTQNGTYTANPIKYTTPGVYPIFYKINADYYNEKKGSYTITIKNADIVANPNNFEGDYDGNEHSGSVTVTAPSSGYKIEYSEDEGETWTESAPSYTEIGRYIVAYKITAAYHNTLLGEYQVKIIGTIECEATGVDTTYDANAHSGFVEVSAPATGYTILYSTNGTNYSSTNPGKTNAGNYTIHYKITANNYHEKTGTFTINIRKAVMQITAEDVEYSYTGGNLYGVVTASKPSNATFTYSTDGENYVSEKPGFRECGKHPLYYKATDPNNNYEDASGLLYVTIIGKITTTVTGAGDIIYDHSSHQGNVIVNGPSTYTIQYSTNEGETWVDENPSYETVGIYKVNYKITADYYEDFEDSFTINIKEATIVTTVTNTEYTYDSNLHGAIVQVVAPVDPSLSTVTYSDSEEGEFVDTPPTYSEIGDYKVFYKVVADNYTTLIDSYTISIKGTIVASAEDVNVVYDKTAKKSEVVVTEPTSGYTIYYSTEDGNYVSTAEISYTNAGEYTVYYKVVAEHYHDFFGSYHINIDNDEIELTTTSYEGIYDTTAHTGSVNVTKPTEGFTILYSTTEEGTYTAGIPTFVNAGDYNVYYIVTATNYNEARGNFDVKINKDDIDVDADDVEYDYDGTAKKGYVTVVKPSDGATITYSSTDSNYTAANPGFITAGVHTLHYKVTAQPNYNDYKGSLTVTINSIDIEASAEDINTTYDGNYYKSDVVVTKPTNGYEIYYSDTEDSYESTDEISYNTAGNHKVYYKIIAPNYNDFFGSYNINIANANIEATATSYRGVHDGLAHLGTVKVNKPSSGYIIEYSDASDGVYTETNPTFTDAGENTVYYRVTAPNYNELKGNFTVNITESDIEVIAPDVTFDYDGTAKYGSVTVTKPNDGSAHITYSTDGITYSDANQPFVEAKEHLLYYRVTALNYNDYEGMLKVIINPLDIEASAEDVTFAYDGTAKKGTVNVTIPTTDYTIYYSQTNGVYESTVDVGATNVGTHVVYYKVTAPNYNDFTSSYTINIVKADIEAIGIPYDGIYDDDEHSGTVEVTKPASGYTITYTESLTEPYTGDNPKFLNTGHYVVKYKVIAPNYNDFFGEFTVDITNAEIEVEADDVEFEYDGTAKTGTVKVIRPNDGSASIMYSADGISYTDNIPEFVDAGNHPIYYKIEANNYNTYQNSFTVTIDPSTIIASAEDVEVTYDGKAYSSIVEVTKPTEGYTIFYSEDITSITSTIVPEFTEAGEHVVHYKVVAPNYNDFISSYKVKINPASIEASSVSYVGEYDGKEHTGKVKVQTPDKGYTILYSDDKLDGYDTSAISYKNTGKHTVYYKVTAPNYIDFEGEFDIEILNADIIVDAPNVSYKYDGAKKNGIVNVIYPSDGTATIQYSEDGHEYGEENIDYVTTGKHTLHYKVTAPNYNDLESSLTVDIKEGDIFAYANNISVNYDGDSHMGEVVVVNPEEGYEIYYSDKEDEFTSKEQLSYSEIGEHIVYYKVVADNYNDFYGNYMININNAPIEAVGIPFEGEYDGEAHTGQVRVIRPIEGYQVTYATSLTGDFEADIPQFTEWGEHRVYFKVTAEGCQDFQDSFVVNILKAVMEVEAEDISYAYDGELKYGIVTVTKPSAGYNITYSADDRLYLKINPGFTDIGVYDLYFIIKAPNYEEYKGSLKVKIDEKPEILINEDDVEFIYDGDPHTGRIEVIRPSEGYTISYSEYDDIYTNTPPSFINAGSYAVYYKVEVEGYQTLLGDFIVTIKPADIEVEVEDIEVPYDNKEHSGEINVIKPTEGYKISYSTTLTGVFKAKNPAFIDVGEYDVFFKITAGSNYNDYDGSFKITITDEEVVESVPIYVMLNPNSGEHLLTSKKNEYDKLQVAGWVGEGIAFYGYSKPVVGCTKIYRIFNPNANMGDHHYTKSVGEINKRLVDGWSWDFNRNAVFYAKGDITIYKLFNRPTGRHHYTRKLGEANKLVAAGWENEGTAWYGANSDDVAAVLKE